jgi:hypothetical protein
MRRLTVLSLPLQLVFPVSPNSLKLALKVSFELTPKYNLLFVTSFILSIMNVAMSLYYKTFYSHNLWIFVIS